jgi:anti-sigma-K factor RskA
VKVAREDLHVLTGSYVLDALTNSEREDFERHLHHCPSCQAEVRGLRETAARLAMAKSSRPPARMESAVLAATYRTRQLPPLPGERAARNLQRVRSSRLFSGLQGSGRRESGLRLPAPGGPPHRSTRRPGADRPSAAGPSAAGRRGMNGPGANGRSADRLSLARRWTQAPRLVGAVAVASVIAAVGLGITQISTQHQLDTVQASNAAITRVVQAPDARIEKKTTAGGTVTVVFSSQRDAAVITTSKLTALPSGRVYQLWVMSPAGPRSAGLVSQPDQASQVLAAGVRPGDKIGMTVEPAGGTSKPTTTPVLVLPLVT